MKIGEIHVGDRVIVRRSPRCKRHCLDLLGDEQVEGVVKTIYKNGLRGDRSHRIYVSDSLDGNRFEIVDDLFLPSELSPA